MFDDGNDGRITSPRRLLRAAMPVTPPPPPPPRTYVLDASPPHAGGPA